MLTIKESFNVDHNGKMPQQKAKLLILINAGKNCFNTTKGEEKEGSGDRREIK